MNNIEKRARELLAAEYRKCGSDQLAAAITNARSYVCDTEINAIIAALTPPEGYVLVSAELLEDLADEAAAGIHQTMVNPAKRANHMRKVQLARDLLAARPEVSP